MFVNHLYVQDTVFDIDGEKQYSYQCLISVSDVPLRMRDYKDEQNVNPKIRVIMF